jgi:hypothetical protein
VRIAHNVDGKEVPAGEIALRDHPELDIFRDHDAVSGDPLNEPERAARLAA